MLRSSSWPRWMEWNQIHWRQISLHQTKQRVLGFVVMKDLKSEQSLVTLLIMGVLSRAHLTCSRESYKVVHNPPSLTRTTRYYYYGGRKMQWFKDVFLPLYMNEGVRLVGVLILSRGRVGHSQMYNSTILYLELLSHIKSVIHSR
jgi:hypothetical protein